jgi:hypothetical protein
MKPKVLIAATSPWQATARLAMAVANAGCSVDALCPVQHPLRMVSVVDQVHTYRGLMPLVSIADAIDNSKPDFILPGDDRIARYLHQIYGRERSRGKARSSTCGLLERSLGSYESFAVVYERTAFIEMAKSEGVRAPKTEVVANANDLSKWAGQKGFPIVLKANFTWGGAGVRIVHTLEEAERALLSLQAPLAFASVLKLALLDQDKMWLLSSLLRRRNVVNAQEFVDGREATSVIFCWNGTVLASLHFEVLRKKSVTGPSTVLRAIENAEMSASAERVVRRLKLSGAHGFDFMLEARTGYAHLIEINPRATQVGHLTLGPGRDLPAALYACLSGQAVCPAPKVTENDIIALFPQEWIRNSESALLRAGYHDVPWEEPELIRACLGKRSRQSLWLSKQNQPEVFSTIRKCETE